MPSMDHEGVLELFRHRPELPALLARDALGIELPAFERASVREADFTQLVPTEYRADLVVTLEGEEPVAGLVVEHQLEVDERKRFSWPLYAAALHARVRRTTWLLVVAEEEGVARWAAQPVATLQPTSPFRPLVIGPAQIPWIRSIEEARRAPELAVLSARAHGTEEGGEEVALAAVAAADGLEPERGRLYMDLVWCALGEGLRRALERLMDTRKFEFESEFARMLQARGRKAGREEGREAGRQEGLAAALLGFLAARGLEVTEAQRHTIVACHDVATLDRWVARAARAASVAEVLID